METNFRNNITTNRRTEGDMQQGVVRVLKNKENMVRDMADKNKHVIMFDLKK